MRFVLTCTVFAAVFCLALNLSAEDKKARNPFDVKDVEDPDGKDVQDYAKEVKLEGDKKDANAEQWVKDATKGKKGALDGEWQERWLDDNSQWNYGKGAAKVKEVNGRVYILANASSGKYLIDLKRDKNRLVGRYVNLDNGDDTGPCVFQIVDDERIDGAWGNNLRWDYRRKLEK